MTELDRLRAALSDRYTLERELGAGGMATVYLAEDRKHHRKVAIKVLRPELAAVIGAERFLSEIQTTANLQHPHILPLFDSGEVRLSHPEHSDGPQSLLFYVMPYVEGISLRDQMDREKQLPIAEAVRIASEVASALDYAHRHGVIHRDIKPANILLQDGSALVADFGIALAASKAGTRMTETGMSLGTPEYMSPEQAMGERDLDARSDVYALGCVLYEMLTGEPPFTGPTAQAIVAKVMTAVATPPEQLRVTVPAPLNDAVMTALQKLPADRFRTAADFATAIAQPGASRRATGGAGRVAQPTRTRLAWTVALMLCSAAAFWLGGRVLGRDAGAPVVLGRATHITWDPGMEVMPALSPDGKTVAYDGDANTVPHVMVRDVRGGRAVALTGDTTSEWAPAWLPDGSRILFLTPNGVFSAPAGGGPSRPEIPTPPSAPITGVTPAPDGTRLAFSRGDSLLVRAADGQVRGLAVMLQPIFCAWSPDGRFIACATGNGLYDQTGANFSNLSPGRITLCRVSDGHLTTVSDSLSLNTSPVWSPDGRWLSFVSNRDGPRDIYTVAIGHDGTAAGEPVRLSAGLGAHSISSSRVGTSLAYSLYSVRTSIWSMPLPTAPGATSADATQVTNANESIENIAVSRDGKWLYYDSDLTGNAEIFRVPAGGGEPQRLTNNPADDFAARPSPDGKSFAFHSWRSGSRDIFVQQLDGSGIVQVTHTAAQEALPDWSPDGKALVFTELSGDGGVWIVKRNAAGEWQAPVRLRAQGSNVTWSPDGKQLLFINSLNDPSIEVMPADSGPVRQILDATRPGALKPDFTGWKDDHTILFTSPDERQGTTLYSLPVSGGTPQPFVRMDLVRHPSSRGGFAVSHGRLFFTADDRQSDIWVVELRKAP